MQIGISAFAWTANFRANHLRILDQVRTLGITAVEIPMFDPANLPVAEIRGAFQQVGLDCTVCAILPADMNPISPETEVRNRAKKHLKRCIECAAEMGAKLIGGPLYAPVGYIPEYRPNSEQWSWAMEAFQSLDEVLQQCRMTLSIEPVNRSETSFLRTASEAKRLCVAIGNPRIGVTIDTFHANIEEPNISSAILNLGPHLKHVHMSENDRGPLGRGHVPFSEIIPALKSVKYGGMLMIEGFGYCADEQNSPGFLWAHMDVSPLDLARESSQHLEQIMNSQN